MQELIEAPPAPPARPIVDIDLPEEQNFLTAPEDIEDLDTRQDALGTSGLRSNNRGEQMHWNFLSAGQGNS